jgi:hypothetical protein
MGKETLMKSFSKTFKKFFFFFLIETQAGDVLIGLESSLYCWKVLGM